MDAFDQELTALVDSGKLSSSKMKSMTDLAMKNIKNDAQIASSLFRTHKRAKASNKLWALYVLDAIARECKSQAKKQARSDRQGSNSPMPGAPADGTPGGFLSKTEMFLERMVDESKANGSPEHLDKIKKLITIWQQAQTFAAPLLARCLARINDSGTTTPPGSPPPVPYRLPSTSSGTMRAQDPADVLAPAPAMPIDAQNALAALLASAQAAPQAAPQASTSASNLLGNLALLQQLAQNTGNSSTPPAETPYRREAQQSPPRRRSASPPPRAAALLQGDPNNPFEARYWIRQGAQSGKQLPSLDQIHAWCLDGKMEALGIPRATILAAAGGGAMPTPVANGANEAAPVPAPRRGRMVQTEDGRWRFSTTG